MYRNASSCKALKTKSKNVKTTQNLNGKVRETNTGVICFVPSASDLMLIQANPERSKEI